MGAPHPVMAEGWCFECQCRPLVHAMLVAEALDGLGVAREAVPDAHRAPEKVILEELVPVPTHARRAGERARVVDEAEDIERDLGRERAEEIALEERSDGRREEEELRRRAFLDEGLQVLPPRGGRERGEGGDVGNGRRVCGAE